MKSVLLFLCFTLVTGSSLGLLVIFLYSKLG